MRELSHVGPRFRPERPWLWFLGRENISVSGSRHVELQNSEQSNVTFIDLETWRDGMDTENSTFYSAYSAKENE